jgi:hypothetical protein
MNFKQSALFTLSLTASAAFAGGDDSNVILVNSLPKTISTPCFIDEAVLDNSEEEILVDLYEESDESNDLVRFRTIELQGSKAAKVKSVELTTIKPGWFPKCGLIIR